MEPELFDSEQTVMAYKDLAKVERAFRSMKTVDLAPWGAALVRDRRQFLVPAASVR